MKAGKRVARNRRPVSLWASNWVGNAGRGGCVVSIGGNEFEEVSVPLVLHDRAFLFEGDDGEPVATVLVARRGEVIPEVLTSRSRIQSLRSSSAAASLRSRTRAQTRSSTNSVRQRDERRLRHYRRGCDRDDYITVATSRHKRNRVTRWQAGLLVEEDGSTAFGSALARGAPEGALRPVAVKRITAPAPAARRP